MMRTQMSAISSVRSLFECAGMVMTCSVFAASLLLIWLAPAWTQELALRPYLPPPQLSEKKVEAELALAVAPIGAIRGRAEGSQILRGAR
jgi:hypothetical protein